MKIYVDSITIDNRVQTLEVPVPDPAWRWTAANGVEYRVEDGAIEPEPDVEIVDHGCGNPECWHKDCWQEEVLREPTTREVIAPRMIRVTRQVPISTRIFGRGRVEGCDDAALENEPQLWDLDGRDVERGPDVAGMRGLFLITKICNLVDGAGAATFEFQHVVTEG